MRLQVRLSERDEPLAPPAASASAAACAPTFGSCRPDAAVNKLLCYAHAGDVSGRQHLARSSTTGPPFASSAASSHRQEASTSTSPGGMSDSKISSVHAQAGPSIRARTKHGATVVIITACCMQLRSFSKLSAGSDQTSHHTGHGVYVKSASIACCISAMCLRHCHDCLPAVIHVTERMRGH